MSASAHQDQRSAALAQLWENIFPKIEDAYVIPRISERIKYWAGEQVELTQILCQYVTKSVDKYASQLDETNAAKLVDQIVRKEILADWKNSQAAFHLNGIANQLATAQNKDLLLLSYLKILQRGAIAADKSVEQALLIQSGLVVENEQTLAIDNPLYAQVFNLAWIEQQLPGITRPVTVVSIAKPPARRSSTAAFLYAKLALCICVIAIIGTAIAVYRRQSVDEGFATQESILERAPAGTVVVAPGASESSDESSGRLAALSREGVSAEGTGIEGAGTEGVSEDRTLFDRGIDHAANSRWLPMIREFCQIPASSTYFMPAKQQLARWAKLYKEEIQVAQSTFIQEESSSCDIVTNVLKAPAN